MRLRTIDLFCGGGGSSWGAKNAGAEIVCGVDARDVPTRTYKANFAGAKALNVRMEEDSGPSILGEIDLLLASPECTNHTCAKGSRPRDEGSKNTAHYVTNFARDLNPRWVVVENVIHMRSWDGYDPLISDLKGLGYNVLPQVGFGWDDGQCRDANDAGWHCGNALDVPDNITLVPLPPYSPECNPVERIWLFLREWFLSLCVWIDQNAIVDACCDAWNALIADSDRIKTLCYQPWVQQVIS